MIWVLTYPERFLYENAELEKLANEVDWLTVRLVITDALIEYHLDIQVHGQIYEARMTYPDVFPSAPPYIRPRNPSEKWSLHQYGEGESLCLEWRTDNWQTNITGADMVRSAYNLLSTENVPNAPTIAPSAHRMTEGQKVRYKTFRSVITQTLLDELDSLQDKTQVVFQTNSFFHSHAVQVAFITSITLPDAAAKSLDDLPAFMTGMVSIIYGLEGKGWLLKHESFENHQVLSTIDDLLKVIQHAGFDKENIVLTEAETGKFIKCQIALYGKSRESLRIFTISPYTTESPITENAVLLPSSKVKRLPDEALPLSDIKVGIVGLGSIGSKVAISLARAGVRNFLVVDDDFLTPDNLVRNEMTWAEVGQQKAYAIKEVLESIAPGISVEALEFRIAGQEPPITSSRAYQKIADCDLLIEATANPEVFLHLASIAEPKKIPICWGEVFAGGYGGLIARARPDLDPNPIAVRDALHDFLSKQEPAPYKDATNYDGEETPLIAYDSNVGIIATWLTNLAIDTALRKSPSEFPSPIYLIGMKKEWIFSQPFDTHPVDATGAAWKEAPSLKSEASIAALKLVFENLSEKKIDNTETQT